MAGAAVSTNRQADRLDGLPGTVTPGAAAYLTEHDLWAHLRTLAEIAEAVIGPTTGNISLAEYDDLSKVRLVQARFEAGLSGRDAIAREDEIADRMLETAGPEAANRFLTIVRCR